MLVLGIEVRRALIEQWRGWLMPAVQPFVVPERLVDALGFQRGNNQLSPEARDSFELYGIPNSDAIVWLDRSEARLLPASVRRSQPAPHRWPTRNAERDEAQAIRYVKDGRRPSRHAEVSERHWHTISPQLPGARSLAGQFPTCSGPNCFATVMTVAGIASAATEWMQVAAFEEWLAQSTRPGGNDDRPGTLLVWRDLNGSAVHAAITIGDGWLIHKPSQGWMSPSKVLAVRDGKLSSRAPGRQLSRYRLC